MVNRRAQGLGTTRWVGTMATLSFLRSWTRLKERAKSLGVNQEEGNLYHGT
jgi:hypothetical protein